METRFNILFLPKYSRKGASSRYRCYNYLPFLSKHGISADVSPLFGDFYLEQLYKKRATLAKLLAIYYVLKRILYLSFAKGRYDHVIIEAELFPHFPLKIDRFFLKRMKSFSLDFDDNISANYTNTPNQDKIPEMIRLSNFTTVGNHWYMEHFEGKLVYLPTVINLEDYPVFRSDANATPIIVWIGSPSTQKYLKILEPVLVELSAQYNFILRIIGGDVALDAKIKTEYVKWEASSENINLATSDIGIMPLEKTYWEMGKCGFKLIQYMASGLPVVATDLPANREIVEEDVSGYIANDLDVWKRGLETLLNKPDERKIMGSKGRKIIEDRYSYQVWGEKYANIIKSGIL